MPEQDRPMLACGHTANAVLADTGQPSCAICDCTEQIPAPNLEGREAVCTYCKQTKPSSLNLPFFQFLGEGSPYATHTCICGYYDSAHGKEGVVCRNGGFQARGPAQHDSFYCGCRGWD